MMSPSMLNASKKGKVFYWGSLIILSPIILPIFLYHYGKARFTSIKRVTLGKTKVKLDWYKK